MPSSVEHRRAAVEHADHDLLAVRRGKRRDAQVDRDAVDRDARAAILRTQPIGDVEARENLDARHERGATRARQRSREREHAVDAMADRDALLFRLDVDVARAAAMPAARNSSTSDVIVALSPDRVGGAELSDCPRCSTSTAASGSRDRTVAAIDLVDAPRDCGRRRGRDGPAGRSRTPACARSRRRADRRWRSTTRAPSPRAEARESAAPTSRAQARLPVPIERVRSATGKRNRRDNTSTSIAPDATLGSEIGKPCATIRRLQRMIITLPLRPSAF